MSLTAAGNDTDSQETARELLAELPTETGWEPDRTLTVAGALKYRQYGLKRFAMRGIAGRAGGDTDTSRNHEYTDWDDVESFALEFADELVALQEG